MNKRFSFLKFSMTVETFWLDCYKRSSLIRLPCVLHGLPVKGNDPVGVVAASEEHCRSGIHLGSIVKF